MAVNETEREFEILAIFRQLLGAPQLGPEQNFFESGGSSLLAARLAARLRTSGVLDVPTSAVFAAPTARALTRYAASPVSLQTAATPAPSAKASSPQPDGKELAAAPSSATERGARQQAAFARLRRASSPAERAR
jgi:Phosphopantetheine attachment site